MRKISQIGFLACGLLLTLAAFPVFAQERVEINRMPFKNLAQIVKKEVDAGKIDLTKSFSIEIEGVLNKDGRLDRKKSKYVKSQGDAAMVEVGKSFIEAVSDSGWLRYLSDLGVSKINFALSQDEKQVTAVIKSEVATANKAKTFVSGINTLFTVAKMQNKDEDAKVLSENWTATADDKNFIINFAAPREAVHELIKKHLEQTTMKESSE